MSGLDRLLLILHIGFAIFTLGPLTAATMSTPRYIRRGDVAVLRYLRRATQLYGLLSLGMILFGVILVRHGFAEIWLTASITLTIVALVLLLIVERDQHSAIKALDAVARVTEVPAAEPPGAQPSAAESEDDSATPDKAEPDPRPTQSKPDFIEIAQVERGRIGALSGVIALLWIVILILMVWH